MACEPWESDVGDVKMIVLMAGEVFIERIDDLHYSIELE